MLIILEVKTTLSFNCEEKNIVKDLKCVFSCVRLNTDSLAILSSICFEILAISRAVFKVEFNIVTLNNFYILFQKIIVYTKCDTNAGLSRPKLQ